MPNQPLQPAEIQQCKSLLGYPNVVIQANPIIGTARVFEDILQQYADDYGIGYIRNTILPNINAIETQIQAARTRYQAARLEGEVTLNPNEHRQLVRLRNFWITRLEEVSGIKRYPGGRTGGGFGGGKRGMDVY